MKTFSSITRYILLSTTILLGLSLCAGQAFARDDKIAVIHMKKILSQSTAGKRAQENVEIRMKELRASFKNEEESLIALKNEIEKKRSVWSESIKKEKMASFQQQAAAFQRKEAAANRELQKLREELTNPILKKMEQVVEKVAKSRGYTMILPNTVVLYNRPENDISELVLKELNKAIK